VSQQLTTYTTQHSLLYVTYRRDANCPPRAETEYNNNRAPTVPAPGQIVAQPDFNAFVYPVGVPVVFSHSSEVVFPETSPVRDLGFALSTKDVPNLARHLVEVRGRFGNCRNSSMAEGTYRL